MKTPGTVAPPSTLQDLLGYKEDCACGRTHSVDTVHASIRSGAIDDLVGFAREVGSSLNVLLVADRITQQVLGDTAASFLNSADLKTEVIVVPDGKGGRPHADDKTLALVESEMNNRDLAVAVGSGTINDLTKLASFRWKVPYIAVATAPSMNGYASAIAAIMQKGVKQTVECHQPFAVVADLDILETAPHHLVASGLGDLESKPTSTADFRLGGLLKRSYYCSAPEKVVFEAEARAAESAQGLKNSDPEAIKALTEALILSGVSMKLAGSSSPASGGEHLISHYWDMTAGDEGRVEGWHGAQVGIATIVTATLFEHLANLDPGTLDFDKILTTRPSKEQIAQRIKAHHGKRADGVSEEFFKKHLNKAQFVREIAWIQENWADIWSDLGDVLRPPRSIKTILLNAGAAVRVSDIGLEGAHLKKAFVAAREIRGRYTVLDLAADLGLLNSLGSEVLDASGCLH